MDSLKLSVLDQSPIRQGGNPADALWETIRLAQHCEKLGYDRFWVAEHHGGRGMAGSSPEVLAGQILARTARIRVGSGGVMLSHYSALKVAEQWRLLEALYPGRVDLGVGRAPGSDQLTMYALAYPKQPHDVGRHFPRQVVDLLGYLTDSMEPEHPFKDVHAGPIVDHMPEVWLLGSSDYSAQLAAELGLPFSYAHFFGVNVHDGPAIAEMYRQEFKPSRFLKEPRVNVTVSVVCADTEEEAGRVASSRIFGKLRGAKGLRGDGVVPPEVALAYPYEPGDLDFIRDLKHTYIDGDPRQVKEQLLQVAHRYKTDDVGVVTICYDFNAKLRSYALVAESFGLQRQD